MREIAKEVADDLIIAYGAEIYYTPDVVEKLEKKLIPTLNDSRYALIEFSMNTAYRDMHKGLSDILMLGITPVIAHIERYDALENNEKRCTTWITDLLIWRKPMISLLKNTVKIRLRNFLRIIPEK